jgi:hypothetical protein
MVGRRVHTPFPLLGMPSSPEPRAALPSPLFLLVQRQLTGAPPAPSELKLHSYHISLRHRLHAAPPLGEPPWPTMLPDALPLTTSSSHRPPVSTSSSGAVAARRAPPLPMHLGPGSPVAAVPPCALERASRRVTVPSQAAFTAGLG